MTLSKIKTVILTGLFALSLASCVSVREYQKSRINDSEMALANRKAEKNEKKSLTFR